MGELRLKHISMNSFELSVPASVPCDFLLDYIVNELFVVNHCSYLET